MNGGVMVVLRAKPKCKRNGNKSTKGRQPGLVLEQGGRLGVARNWWFINAVSKKPLLGSLLQHVQSIGPLPLFIIIGTDNEEYQRAISAVMAMIRFVFVASWGRMTSILSFPVLWEICGLERPAFVWKFMNRSFTLILVLLAGLLSEHRHARTKNCGKSCCKLETNVLLSTYFWKPFFRNSL